MSGSSDLERVSDKSITPNTSIVTSSPQVRDIRLRDVPFLLFQEVSNVLGVGKETQIKIRGSIYTIRELDPNHKATGFKGAIGFWTDGEHYTFAFWPHVPRPDNIRFEDEHPMLRLNGGPQFGGEWVYGWGNFITEKLYADFGMSNIYLTDPAVRFVALLLFRATQLAQNPNVTKENYWEVERNPVGNFS